MGRKDGINKRKSNNYDSDSEEFEEVAKVDWSLEDSNLFDYIYEIIEYHAKNDERLSCY